MLQSEGEVALTSHHSVAGIIEEQNIGGFLSGVVDGVEDLLSTIGVDQFNNVICGNAPHRCVF
jgi:hypothetical protein